MTRKIPVVGLSLLLSLAVAASAVGRQPLRTLSVSGQFSPVKVHAKGKFSFGSLIGEGKDERLWTSSSAQVLRKRAETARSRLSSSPVTKLTGIATWYCLTGTSVCPRMASHGMYAAAGPALRKALGPSWRGKWVTVARGKLSVRVQLIDWCACGGGHTIDLFGDAFSRLAPLSQGAIRVSLRW